MSDQENLQRIEDWCNNIEPEIIQYDVVEPEIFEKPIPNWQQCRKDGRFYFFNSSNVNAFCIKLHIDSNYDDCSIYIYGMNKSHIKWSGSVNYLIMIHKLTGTYKVTYEDDFILMYFSMDTIFGNKCIAVSHLFINYINDEMDIMYSCDDRIYDSDNCSSTYSETYYYRIKNDIVYHTTNGLRQTIAIIVWIDKSICSTVLYVDFLSGDRKITKRIDSASIAKYYANKQIGYYIPLNILNFDNFTKCIKKGSFPNLIDFKNEMIDIEIHFSDKIGGDCPIEFIRKKMNT